MKLKELVEILDGNQGASLHIMLPNSDFVPEHFHVTEVGRVQKTFIDCGGVQRETVTCLLQIWTAQDFEHRLSAGKLLKILNLGKEILGSDDLLVEFEYGADVASQFTLSDVEITPRRNGSIGLLFVLLGKQTDCLAPDKCGVNQCCGGKC